MVKLDGKELATKLKEGIKSETAKLKEQYGKVPGLAIVLIGDNPASKYMSIQR